MFDICLVDIILPAEDATLPVSAADETGLRLIRHIVEHRKSSRIIILTQRLDLAPRFEKAIKDQAQWVLLIKLKQHSIVLQVK